MRNRAMLGLVMATLWLGCTAPMGGTAPGPVLFQSEANYISATLPPGWAAAEGPADLSGGVLMHAPTGIVSFNSWGEAEFWAVGQSQQVGDGMLASLGPEQILDQIPDHGVYLVLTEFARFAGKVIVSPDYHEHTAQDVNELGQPADCHSGNILVNFTKWGRAYQLGLYCAPTADDAVIDQANELVASLRFDAVPAGDERWGVLQARAQLPASVTPQQFMTSGTIGNDKGQSWATHTDVLEDRTVRVSFFYFHELEMGSREPNRVFEMVDNEPVVVVDRCLPAHWWQYDVLVDGAALLVGEGGGDLPTQP